MSKLLSKTHVRQFALDASQTMGRPFTRVSQEFIDEVEADLRQMVLKKIRTRPSIGITLK